MVHFIGLGQEEDKNPQQVPTKPSQNVLASLSNRLNHFFRPLLLFIAVDKFTNQRPKARKNLVSFADTWSILQ